VPLGPGAQPVVGPTDLGRALAAVMDLGDGPADAVEARVLAWPPSGVRQDVVDRLVTEHQHLGETEGTRMPGGQGERHRRIGTGWCEQKDRLRHGCVLTDWFADPAGPVGRTVSGPAASKGGR